MTRSLFANLEWATMTGALLLVGCYHHSSVTAFAAAERGFSEATGTDAGDCLRRAEYMWARDAREYRALCVSDVDESASCWTTRTSGNIATAVLRPGQPIDEHGEPLVHEALHGLMGCHRRTRGLDWYDANHTDPAIWLEHGDPDSAQGRARRHYDASQ